MIFMMILGKVSKERIGMMSIMMVPIMVDTTELLKQ